MVRIIQKSQEHIPPDHEGQDGAEEAVLDEINAIKHLSASRPRKSLRDAEQLLILKFV